MAFVNEYISEADVEKYNLEDIDKRFVVGGVYARDWTIDRGRETYLRIVARGREDWRSHTEWTLYWKGDLLVLKIELLDHKGKPGQPGWSHWKLTWIGLPERLRPRRNEILSDLKEALLAYKGSGVYSTNTDYEITLDINEDVK